MFGINSDERGYLGPHSVISDLRHLMSLLPSAPIHLPSYRLTHEFVADRSSRTAVLGDNLVPMREVIDHADLNLCPPDAVSKSWRRIPQVPSSMESGRGGGQPNLMPATKTTVASISSRAAL